MRWVVESVAGAKRYVDVDPNKDICEWSPLFDWENLDKAAEVTSKSL